ncbi:MAG: TonB-dependent receptor [Muribaculaceae bacterium]|jgi:TonB-linked SusC/RagA family outer membrane protein|nr:TonB-dependent receptor [Muribaculaceae bacterium]
MSKRFITAGMLSSLLLIGGAASTHAQAITVAQQTAGTCIGTIVSETGEEVIGATVKVQGTSMATSTNIDGHFSLTGVKPGAILEISCIGYEPLTVTWKGEPLSLTMKETANALDEVVVVGYGQQKKVNLTGSVASVNMDKISDTRPITNVSQALAGLASGVNVTSGNNQPGNDNATIRVRGVGTLNDASPLVIIDGVEAGINTVNPSDIESMSILKDAASAAIYGSRAANGVILITTKKGQSGSVKVNYNGYVSFESIRKTLTPVSNYADYMELINEGYYNTYGQKNYIFSDAVINEWRANEGGDQLRYPNQDWIDATFKNATATNHTVSMSGGSDKIRFYTSFGYLNNPGVMPNAGFSRYSARVSVDADVTKWLTIGALASGYRGETQPGARVQDDIFTYASATTPGMVFLAPDGRFGAMNNTEDDSQCAVNNPISRAYRIEGNQRKNNSRIRFTGTFRPYEGITVVGSYNYELVDTEQRQKPHFVQGWNFKDDVMTYDSTGKTSVSNSDAKVERYFWDAVGNYDKKFWDRLQFNLMVGASSELYRSKSFNASRQDLIDLGLWALGAATGDASAGGSSTEWSMLSYFGRVNLNWMEKYLLEFNLRYDGSSRFQKGRRWGHFPSASAGWRMEREAFMQGLVDKGLDALKLRVSYGKLGNNSIGNYDTQALYTSSGMNYVLGNSLATGLAQSALANALLTWESTNVFNVAADLMLFNSRLSATLEYFHKKTDNILISLPAPAVHGTTSLPKVNSAQVSNQGFELTLTWNDRIGNVNYGINANATYVKNNVDKFKGKDKAGMSISGANLIWEGHPINSQYLLKVDRIIQTDEDLALVQKMIDNAPVVNGKKANPFAAYGTPEKGDLLYQDVNGDGVIDADDRTIVSDGPNPKWMLGLNLTAEWKGIDFGMLLQASLGAKRYWQSTAYNTPTVRYGYQLNKEVCDGRWYEGRTDATYPRLLFYQNNINQQASDFYLQDLAYLKIRNIQLGYTLPQKWTRACQIDKVRIYGSLENFFTFTKFKGFDPEVSGMAYPTMRQAVIGLNVAF